MSQNLRSPRETPRLIDAVRRGAEAGVAQVLTPAEALALSDRLADAEAVERTAEEVVDGYLDCGMTVLSDALAARKTRPVGTTLDV